MKNSKRGTGHIDTKNNYRKLHGIPVSPGISIGRAFIYESERYFIEEKTIKPEEVDKEIQRFRKALQKVSQDLKRIQNRIRTTLTEEHAKIFTAHIMLLEDPVAITETEDRIRNDLKSAEFAFFRTIRKVVKVYKKLDDEYLRERISDIDDIAHRVFAELLGEKPTGLGNITSAMIIVSPNLTPTDTARFNTSRILGIVTEYGGSTSHTAILARALEIPAVLGVHNATTRIEPGYTIILDGQQGIVHVNPPQEIIEEYLEQKKELKLLKDNLRTLRDFPAVTKDGKSEGYPSDNIIVLE